MAIVLAAALCNALAGCGGGSDEPQPRSLGVGWTEPRLARAAGVGTPLMAAALGPNARSVPAAAPRLRRSFDFDPLAARRLISVGGSYAFGLRLDGVDVGGLRDALIAVGGTARDSEGVELVDVGDYAEVPEPLLEAKVFGLGARDAFAPGLAVLAISETARDSLLGRGQALIDQPTYRAAADCLGDVVAARLIPDKLLISVELGVDLVAVGVGQERGILCLVGGTSERAGAIAAALRAGLTSEAREPGGRCRISCGRSR